MAGTNNGTTVLLPFWCYMIYGGVIGLLDSWCKSMRNAIPRPTIIGRWVSVTSMVFIMLSFITIVLTRALLRKGYIIQNWLSDLATIAQFIGLNMVMIMAGVLLKMSPTKTAFKQDRKRREITMLIAVYFLLLLHRIFTQINVPYTEFAIFPLIGIFTLYPLNALEGYSRSTGAPVTKPMNLV
ncbi:hypothetical protein BDF19DRAFT_424417 [Syncephalis fuscata]|nr:hypothetical protein BDF19DRAFT_424417 [Syncephalis fuscata]